MLNEKLKSRVENWKFESALKYIDDKVTDGEKEIIKALARLFGNSGWFYGDMGILVDTVLDFLNTL